jgi:hypothetical protein
MATGWLMPGRIRIGPTPGGDAALRIEGTGQGLIVAPMAGSNVLRPRTTLPTLTGVIERGERVLECTVTLT